MNVARPRVALLDTWIDKVDLTEARSLIHDFIRGGTPRQVVTVNLDFLRLSTQDQSFRALINNADLVVPDGMPLIWASRLLNDPLPQRVAGVDLVVECARLAAEHDYRVFFLGAAPGVANAAADVLRNRFPRLNIVGIHAPPTLNAAEDAVSLETIRAAAPDILLVAFGAPRQDQWIQTYLHRLDVPVCMGVGGAFDMLSGRLSRAPAWMQRSGVEWLHRFLLEPGRLWKRYFVHDLPVFLRLMLACSLSTSSQPIPAQSWERVEWENEEAVVQWPHALVAQQEVVHPTTMRG